jgi:hypothetical protein
MISTFPMVRATVAGCALALVSPVALEAQSSTAIDHHQHMFSVEAAVLAPGVRPWTADDLITMLDEAGIKRAAVFSIAYQFSNPNRQAVADEYAKVRAENDWTSARVARHPARLRGFCSVNPLRDDALDEIRRCAMDPFLRHGLKLHFGNSDVRLTRVYFDASGVAGLGQWTEKAPLIARRIRELGVHRVLYGSDGTTDLLRPRDAMSAFRQLLCRRRSSRDHEQCRALHEMTAVQRRISHKEHEEHERPFATRQRRPELPHPLRDRRALRG